MLLSEKFEQDGDKIHHVRTHDFAPALDRAAALRSNDLTGFGENWLIGSIPAALLTHWLTEAGVAWDDTAAVQEILRKKLQDGEFAKFRVHEGRF